MRLLHFINDLNETSVLIERDVANAPAIKEWVINMSQRVNDSNARKWFQSQLFSYFINTDQGTLSHIFPLTKPPADAPDWLYNKIMSGQPVYQLTPNETAANIVMEVIDWINYWSEENPGSRINYTWEQAVQASQEWHKQLSRTAGQGTETFDDEGLIIFKEYSDGFKWVDVQSESCLNREGNQMGHCVGTYNKAVSNGTTRILSLRSPQNKPHVTVEVNDLNVNWWLEQGKTIDPYQSSFNFSPSLDGKVVGTINQIKGRQNKPPVPKYIPYVKDLIDTLPFDFTTYGKSDLETIGWYARDGKLVGLKDIAELFMKSSGGYNWVIVKETSKASVYSRDALLKLIDTNWVPHINISLYIEDGKYKVRSFFGMSGGEIYHNQMLELMNEHGEDLTLTLPDKAEALYTYGIFLGDGGYGDPKTAAGRHAVHIEEGDFWIYKLYGFKNFTNQYYTHGKKNLFLFDTNNRSIGIVVLKHIDENFKPSLQLENLQFEVPGSFTGNYVNAMIETSKKIGTPIYQPDRYALNDQYETINVLEDYTNVGVSTNNEYDYWISNDDKKVIVTERDVTYPIAIVTQDESYRFDIMSGQYTDYLDYGLFGYIILDLDTQGVMKIPAVESEYDMMDYGWVSTTNRYGSSAWIFARGGDKFQVTLTSETTDSDGDVIDHTVEETTLGELDEMIVGAEEDSYLPFYAYVLMHGQDSVDNDFENDDDGTMNTETYVVELNDDKRKGYWLTFDDYSLYHVEQLMV